MKPVLVLLLFALLSPRAVFGDVCTIYTRKNLASLKINVTVSVSSRTAPYFVSLLRLSCPSPCPTPFQNASLLPRAALRLPVPKALVQLGELGVESDD